MARELLPATFDTEERATAWSRFLTHRSIIQSDTRVVPARGRPGRFQVLINRKAAPKPEEQS